MSTHRLDEIDEILAASGVPGAAIGIVIDGAIVVTQGFGREGIETETPKMTPRSVYPIGSTTKAMNSTLIAMLVGDGLISWDRPVRDYLPAFEFPDPVASRLVTLRDLVTMRTGAGRHDWLWASGELKRREDLIARYAHLPAISLFREAYSYNNLGVLMAGHALESVAGVGWEQLLVERILGPLDMSDTITARPANVIPSYWEETEGSYRLTQPLPGAEVGVPMGTGVHSHIEDMLKWICFNLAGGRDAGGRQLLSEEGHAELWTSQILLGDGALDGYGRSATYALGWFVDDFGGHRRISHGGYLNEVDSWIMMLPDSRLGVVVFNNAGESQLAKPIAEFALDAMLRREPTVDLGAHLAAYRERRRARWQELESARPVPDARRSHSLIDFTGTYRHAGYGELTVTLGAEKLSLDYGTTTLALAHWHYDSWIAEGGERFGWEAQAFDRLNRLTFDTDQDGRIAGLAIRLEQLSAPIRFEHIR